MQDLLNVCIEFFQWLKTYITAKDTIQDGSTKIAYQEYTYTIPVGGREPVYTVFDYFRVISLSANTLSVQFGGNGIASPWAAAGLGLACENKFDRVTLINTGAAPITITIAVANGHINDDRLTVSGTVSITGIVQVFWSSATTIATAQTSVANAATQLIVGSNQNVKVRIYAGDEDLYIGFTNAVTTANGYKIPAGETWECTDTHRYTGNIYGIRSVASGVNAFTMIESN